MLNNEKRNREALADVRRFVSQEEVDGWLKKNPPPTDWDGTLYEWAMLEMPARGIVGRFLRWLGA